MILTSKVDLTQLTLGELFGAFFIVCAFVLSIYKLWNYVYGAFIKAHNVKKNDENLNATVSNHTQEIDVINSKMDGLMEMFNKLMEINKIQTRHYIVETCSTALSKGSITQYQLQSLEDMYQMYTDVLHGNSYVTTIMQKARKLEIDNTTI